MESSYCFQSAPGGAASSCGGWEGGGSGTTERPCPEEQEQPDTERGMRIRDKCPQNSKHPCFPLMTALQDINLNPPQKIRNLMSKVITYFLFISLHCVLVAAHSISLRRVESF